MARLTAAVVIPTYRRPEVLAAALDAWVASTRRPDQFVVVDASPDAADAREVVLRTHGALFNAPGSAYVGAAPGLTAQRNAGLDLVHCDVVAFADDDTRVEAGYLQQVMEVFEVDDEGVVGGVGGTNRRTAGMGASVLRMTLDVGRRYARRLEVPSGPAWDAQVSLPAAVSALPVTRRRNLHGASMSLRTELAKQLRFDERIAGAAYCEDFDMSYRVSRTHALVRRRDAMVLHEPAPGGRAGAAQRFLSSWVNPAYLVEKLFPVPSSRRRLRRLFVLDRGRAHVVAHFARGPAREWLELYDLAELLMKFVGEGPPSELGNRFQDAQEWIRQLDSTRSPGRNSGRGWPTR